MWKHLWAFGVGPWTVIGGTIGLFGLLSPLWGWGDKQTALASVVIAVVLAYLGTFRQNIALGKRLERDLKFDCGPRSVEEPYGHPATPAMPPVVVGGKLMPMTPAVPSDYCRWLRVVVETKNDAPVTDCMGELIAITRVGHPPFLFNNQRLTFSPNLSSRTIHPKFPEFLEIIRIGHDQNDIQIGTPNRQWDHQPTAEIFSTHSDYFITVAIKSENKSDRLELQFTWTGDWQNSKLTLLSVS